MGAAGDPWGESDVLVAIQGTIGTRPEVLRAARAMSHFGEHALGWFAIAGAGYVVDRHRRSQWVGVGVATFVAHAASVVLKRVVRRPRPHDPRIAVGVSTPSQLSFPSSHATSSTAALVGIAHLTGSPLPLVGVPLMALSRLVLGVHYPSDVALGTALGAATAEVTRCASNRMKQGKSAPRTTLGKITRTSAKEEDR